MAKPHPRQIARTSSRRRKTYLPWTCFGIFKSTCVTS